MEVMESDDETQSEMVIEESETEEVDDEETLEGLDEQPEDNKLYLNIWSKTYLIYASTLNKNKLDKAKNLLKFLKEKLKLITKNDKIGPYPPIELVFDGRVLKNKDEIKPEKTTPENPIYIYRKYVKEPKIKANDKFFRMRGISFESQIYEKHSFNGCLGQISVDTFPVPENYKGVLDDEYKKAQPFDTEALVQHFVGTMLNATYKPNEDVYVRPKYSIKVPDHKVIVDHVVIKKEEQEPIILLAEDKMRDLKSAVLQNFDQLRTISLSPKSKGRTHFYGIASIGDKWQACCYIKPGGRKAVDKSNFMVSEVKDIALNPETGCIVEGMLELFLRVIRGFMIKKDLDSQVDKKLQEQNIHVNI